MAGSAHVVLAEPTGSEGLVGRFADHAVPALVERLQRLGVVRPRLKAILVGGASMFALGGNGLAAYHGA